MRILSYYFHDRTLRDYSGELYLSGGSRISKILVLRLCGFLMQGKMQD